MPHIHTEPGQHDHTVTGYVVRIDGVEPKVLLHMHKKLNMLLPPGGHIELDETPWVAMTHELREEVGYDIQQLSVLQPRLRFSQDEVTDEVILHPQPLLMNTHDITPEHYHSDTAYAFVATSGPLHPLPEGESADIRWITKDELVGLSPSDIWQNTRAVYLAILDRFMTEWESVPATEYIL